MSDYSPSFRYGSKLTSNNDTVNVENQTVNSQADQSNTMGSVTKQMSRQQVAVQPPKYFPPLDYGNISTIIGGVLSSGLATYHDILTNPEFQCSLTSLAASLQCGGDLPECPSPKDILAVKQEAGADGKVSWSVECGCADTEADTQQFTPDENDILSVSLGAEDCQRKARNEAFTDCITISPDVLKGDPDSPWNEYGELFSRAIKEIMNDENLSPDQKKESIRELINTINNVIFQNGWDDHPSYSGYQNDMLDLFDDIAGCANDVKNDCALNTIPSAATIKLVLMGMSRKPEKTCKGEKTLNDNCECVCPSGEFACPDTDDCLSCMEGAELESKTSFFLGTPYCECKCPEGTVETYIGDPSAVQIPEYAGGPTEAEKKATLYACLPPCPEGMARHKGGPCSCRKNTGSWLFPKFELVPASGACDSAPNGTILDGYKPDPKNNCECECNERGYEVHVNGPDSEGRYTQRCREICPFGITEYDWDSDSCKCTIKDPCPEGQSRSLESSCTCSSGSYSYTNLTLSELAKIAKNFNYSLDTSVDLL